MPITISRKTGEILSGDLPTREQKEAAFAYCFRQMLRQNPDMLSDPALMLKPRETTRSGAGAARQ